MHGTTIRGKTSIQDTLTMVNKCISGMVSLYRTVKGHTDLT